MNSLLIRIIFLSATFYLSEVQSESIGKKALSLVICPCWVLVSMIYEISPCCNNTNENNESTEDISNGIGQESIHSTGKVQALQVNDSENDEDERKKSSDKVTLLETKL